MPHDQEGLSPESEKLCRKIDRLLAGQPAPVLDNPDTEDLADLAAMLQRYLSKDLPDPGFRAQLKEDLINPHPRLVHLPRRARPRRYPISAFAGALAFAMIAAVATGWMVFDSGDDSLNIAAKSGALSGSATATARPAAFAMATGTVTTEVAPGITGESTPLDEPTDAPAEATPEVADEGAADESGEPPLLAPAATPTALLVSTPTQAPAPIDLPPIDKAHIEFGALATVTGDSAPIVDGVTYTLAEDLPDLDRAASAYRFSTPHVQPDLIVRSVADFLGFDEEKVETMDHQGRTVYSLGSPTSGATFMFSPTTGAFSCTVPESHASADIEDLTAWAIDWLQDFGYPVDDGARPIIKTLETGEREIHIPVDDLPEAVVGHPMSVSLVIDPEGRIVRVSGYWLKQIEQSELTLLTPEQAWEAIAAGQGYWPDGQAPTEPGEFRLRTLGLTYMLTVDDDNQLVLQPVISASGMFHPTDGSEAAPGTVYLQAAAQA